MGVGAVDALPLTAHVCWPFVFKADRTGDMGRAGSLCERCRGLQGSLDDAGR